MKAYKMRCGNLHYTVKGEVKDELDALMYWTFEEQMAVQKEDEEMIDKARRTLEDIFSKLEKLEVPNWVVNGARSFAEENDLRDHSVKEFYEKSVYAYKTTELRDR